MMRLRQKRVVARLPEIWRAFAQDGACVMNTPACSTLHATDSPDALQASLLFRVRGRRYISSGRESTPAVTVDAAFYEKEVKTRKQGKNKDLSIVRRLPKSARRIQTRKDDRKNENFRTKGNPIILRERSKQYQSTKRSTRTQMKTNKAKTTIFQAGMKPYIAVEDDSDSSGPSNEEIPKRMFRQDWMRMRKDKTTFMEQSNTRQATPYKKSKPKPSKIHNTQYSDEYANRTEKHEKGLLESFPPQKLDIFVSCLPGLEPYLKEEMETIGIPCSIEAGGVTSIPPTLTVDDIMKCHLFLGTASHILVRCGKPFTARKLPELKRKVARLPWHQFLKQQTPLRVKVTAKKSKLNHSTAIRSAVVDGINESYVGYGFDKNSGVSLASDDDSNALHMVVRLERDELLLSVDTSENPIHRRGYRLETVKAPLREDLAYAMIYSAGWGRSSREEAEPSSKTFNAFLDPFCGSGTIAIEAAAIAAGFPPGRLRPSPFRGTVLYDSNKWRNIIRKTLKATRKKIEGETFHIAASDRDAGAVAATTANAKRAGVEHLMDIQRLPMSGHPWLESKSEASHYPLLIATNPPFGLRIAADKKKSRSHPLLPLYQTLIDRQRLLTKAGRMTSTVILLQDPNVFRKTGAEMKVQFSSQHGGVPVAAVFTGSQGL